MRPSGVELYYHHDLDGVDRKMMLRARKTSCLVTAAGSHVGSLAGGGCGELGMGEMWFSGADAIPDHKRGITSFRA